METDQFKTFWQFSKDAAFKMLDTSIDGLDDNEAEKRLREHGSNTIKADSKYSGILLFLSQFKSPVTIMLIVAALLSASLGDVMDTVIILTIVLISSCLGFWQERGAANAVKELLKMVQLHCDVLRGGKKKEITVEEVVPGDLIILSAGDLIPADSLLIVSQELFVDEAAFTGETYPVEKFCGELSPCDQRQSERPGD
jgi:Mg2+-importing ATPase